MFGPMLVYVIAAIVISASLGALVLVARSALSGMQRKEQSPTARRAWIGFYVVIFAALILAVPVAVMVANADSIDDAYGTKLNVSATHGREIFNEHCGVCHRFTPSRAEGAISAISLDEALPTYALTLRVIHKGIYDGSGTLGPGQQRTAVMPPQIVRGKDARDIAAYVSRVAGQPAK